MDGDSGTPPTPPFSTGSSGAGGGVPPPVSSTAAAGGNPNLRRPIFAAPRHTGPKASGQVPPAPPAATVTGNKRARPKRSSGGPAAARAGGGKKTKANTGPRGKPPPSSIDGAGNESMPPPPPPPPAPPAGDELQRSPDATASALNMFDEMSQSMDNDEFMEHMNITQSQEYETHSQVDQELDAEEEGFLTEARGRAGNYTVAEDVLLCNTWKRIGMDAEVGTEQPREQYWDRMKEYFDANNTSGNERSAISLRHRWSTISSDCQKWSGCLSHVETINPSGTSAKDRNNIALKLFKGAPKKNKKGKLVQGRSFTLPHCWEELEHDEKWKNRDLYEVPRRATKKSVGEATIAVDDDASSDEDDPKRSSTPHSVAKTKRPDGRKYAKEKGKRTGDDDIKNSLDAIVNARKEMAEERKMMRAKEAEERMAAEERRVAAEERRVAVEERKLALEEKKMNMEETLRVMESEKNLMFMNTSEMDVKQKEYVELMRDHVLAQKRMMGGYMNGYMGGAPSSSSMGGMGGYMGGMPSMSGMGGIPSMANMGGMPSMGGMGGMPSIANMGGMPSMGDMGGMPSMANMGGMPSMGGMGGMPSMGGYMASMVSPIPPYGPSMGVKFDASMGDGMGASMEGNGASTATTTADNEDEAQKGDGIASNGGDE